MDNHPQIIIKTAIQQKYVYSFQPASYIDIHTGFVIVISE